ncbi:hypothetical protein BWK59_13480 [Flavobacterium davisii]|uniref:DM13 domain-containing protein n=1 Tax=Flavobacterium davisii TaxID=2906077 RepID=A0A246GFG4_9FLAO|nr:hypothetical protein BWK59_13480 [Flavobacterium davisii]
MNYNKYEKKILLGLSFLIFSCEQEGVLVKQNTTLKVSESAVLLQTGNFLPTSGISAVGKVDLFLDKEQYKLKLSDVMVSSGPDLRVYLSKSDTTNSVINLGNFMNNETSTYLIPSGINIKEYRYVLIHCQQYDHIFATALLK